MSSFEVKAESYEVMGKIILILSLMCTTSVIPKLDKNRPNHLDWWLNSLFPFLIGVSIFIPLAWKAVGGLCDSESICVCMCMYVCVCSSLVRFSLFGSHLKSWSPITTVIMFWESSILFFTVQLWKPIIFGIWHSKWNWLTNFSGTWTPLYHIASSLHTLLC